VSDEIERGVKQHLSSRRQLNSPRRLTCDADAEEVLLMMALVSKLRSQSEGKPLTSRNKRRPNLN